jgi:hypothetical protein
MESLRYIRKQRQQADGKRFKSGRYARANNQAKKFLAERSPAYMTARTALKDLHRLTDPLYAAQSILPPKPSFTGPERGLINGWKAYLTWEQDNKLVIEDKDALASRIGYAMRQCVGQMRHFPELWYVPCRRTLCVTLIGIGITCRFTIQIRAISMKPLRS